MSSISMQGLLFRIPFGNFSPLVTINMQRDGSELWMLFLKIATRVGSSTLKVSHSLYFWRKFSGVLGKRLCLIGERHIKQIPFSPCSSSLLPSQIRCRVLSPSLPVFCGRDGMLSLWAIWSLRDQNESCVHSLKKKKKTSDKLDVKLCSRMLENENQSFKLNFFLYG